MYGVGPQVITAFYFVFLFPIAFAFVFTLPIGAVTFAKLALQSPHRKKLRWWLFMPIASLAGALIGTLEAGLLFWLPTLALCGWRIPALDGLTQGLVFYIALSSAVSCLFSVHWTSNFDRKIHTEN